eukprot:TRINITY_DN50253_c0_g1_i1.p1 TRINITY_DN50253_c0_g1~~TRINITY_DN50253_c0_g1_i1.p1  ORF type:complete len:442 (+),score=64.30 TRINITY_DN50253_c0_g1_i1:77-1402(+)
MFAVCTSKRCRNLPPHPPHGSQVGEASAQAPSVSPIDAVVKPFQLSSKVVSFGPWMGIKTNQVKFEVIPSHTVDEVKARIASGLGIAVSRLRSVHQYLGNNIVGGHLADHGIVSDTELFLVIDPKAAQLSHEAGTKKVEAAEQASDASARIAHTLVDFNNDTVLRRLVNDGLKSDTKWQRAFKTHCAVHGVDWTLPADLDIGLVKEFIEQHLAEFADQLWARWIVQAATLLDSKKREACRTGAGASAERDLQGWAGSEPPQAVAQKLTSTPGLRHSGPSATAASSAVLQSSQNLDKKPMPQKRKAEDIRVPRPSSAPSVAPSAAPPVPSSAPQQVASQRHSPSQGPSTAPSCAPVGQQFQSKRDELREWLRWLDGGTGVLLEYFDVLVDEFDGDLVQIAAAKVGGSEQQSVVDKVDPLFWETVGVTRIGHKILFARGIAEL